MSHIPQNKIYIYIIGCLLILAAAFAVYSNTLAGGISGNNYRAVFLTNDQVYFGKIVSQNTHQIVLKEVFYLEDSSTINTTTSTEEVALVKMGKELHAPTDSVAISRAQILFTQTLGADSRIAQAIAQYKSGR